MNTNKISAELSDADQAAALQKITELNTLLSFLVALTAEQKKRLNKAANKRVPFIQQVYVYLQQHPEVLPGTFDLAEFGKDVTLLARLAAIIAAHDAQNEKLHDTMALDSSESYEQALEGYDCFKRANKGGEYDTVLAALSAFFEGQGPQGGNAAKPQAHS